ncbi:hypothetical protein Agub_g14740, partial [Astrephomene gubernaculifera]
MPTTEELLDAIERACTVGAQEENEEEPYKHKYEAADLIKRVLGERGILASAPVVDGTGKDSSGDSPAAQESSHPTVKTDDNGSSPSTSEVPEKPSHLELATAAARIRCGLILLDTDLLADGEASILAGLPLLETSPDTFLAWLLESYNALGALYSQRGELQRALSLLQRAEALYQRITGTGTRHAHLPHLPLAHLQQQQRQQQQGEGEGKQQQEEGTQEQQQVESRPGGAPQEVGEQGQQQGPQEQGATTTSSQGEATATEDAAAAASAGASAASAEPVAPGQPDAAEAAATTSDSPDGADGGAAPTAAGQEGQQQQQQEEQPAHSSQQHQQQQSPAVHSHLPRNDDAAVQSQYTSTLFYLAQVYGHLQVADRSALYCAATLYRQLATGTYELDTWVNNCLQLGGYYAKVHAFGLALYCHAAAQAVADRDTAAGAQLGEDIAANIKLATARVYNMRLAASHSQHVEGKQLEMHYPDVSYFPDYLRFPGLAVPSPDSFPWGPAALASNFEAARELFNTGMPYFKSALSYYQLDGWVTEHVNILMDMSNMYRCLAGFEADLPRCAAMHRCRAQLLEPLSGGALNPAFYPGLARSVELELAHVWREVADLREAQGGQGSKVVAAATSAVKYYNRFLRSFVSSETGQLPDRVDPDNEPYFLMASFGLGRMMHR